MSGAGELKARAALLGLFETPVLHAQVTDPSATCAALAEAVRARRAIHAGVDRSNVGGWHSATDMLEWGGPAAREVADLAVRLAKRLSHFDGRDAGSVEWSVRMWANVSPPGALNMSHAHPGVLWAAVFYVDMGDAGEGGGELYLEDPRFPLPQARMAGFRMIGGDGQPQSPDRRITTKAGDLVVFPAWLRHGVRPHGGTRERISIAMNLDAT
ncbi:TIGR02466 family protein [uncultured Sphingomonas sp.]|uniref:TIGR02466 family protein n=1 Tax=uncultured Sphingomonas sp. TaxID=158754 RepID=UPI0025CD1B0F|nr:TIGR02466 family protein [uncultured Sphingomonas sp.]